MNGSVVLAVGKILTGVLAQLVKAGFEAHLRGFSYGGAERFLNIGSKKEDILFLANLITEEEIIKSALCDEESEFSRGVYIIPDVPVDAGLVVAISNAMKELCFTYLSLVVEKRDSDAGYSSKEDVMEEAAEELERIIFRLFV